MLLRLASLVQLEPPQRRNQDAVARLIQNDGQLCNPDSTYIQNVDDLVALGGDKEHSWVHGVVEEVCTSASSTLSKVMLLNIFGQKLTDVRKLFQNKIQALKVSNKLGIYLYSKPRFDRLVSSIFTLIIVGLIMVPIFVLYRIRKQSGYVQNGVALGFTTFFALLCSTGTTAKRHEIFAATAAYCAVLVVFITESYDKKE
jgi:hypothetical protein